MGGSGPRDATRRTARAATTRRGLVENELLEQATKLFAERGYAGTSLQDVAEALGITRPALYHYVKSKDELLARLVTEVTNGPLDDLTELARSDSDPVRTLRGIVEVIVRRRTRAPERFRLLVRSEAELPAELREAYNTSRRGVLAVISGVIDDGVRAGLFRPVDSRITAFGLLGMCNWVAWWFRPDGPDDPGAVVDELADMAVGALQRADPHGVDGDGPAAALKILRRDLDHLERVLDL